MRLYLSSLDLGNAASELKRLAPQGKLALIMNALDGDTASRGYWQESQTRQLQALGFDVEALDLRDYFDDPVALRSRLTGFGMVWINGGNTFVLMRAMTLSGFDHAIKERLADDSILYAGFSAATVAAAPSLRGLEAADDPNDVPEGYPAEIVWDGLGLLPFQVVVHYRTDHPEAAVSQAEVAYYEREELPYRMLRDGQVLIVRGSLDQLELIS